MSLDAPATAMSLDLPAAKKRKVDDSSSAGVTASSSEPEPAKPAKAAKPAKPVKQLMTRAEMAARLVEMDNRALWNGCLLAQRRALTTCNGGEPVRARVPIGRAESSAIEHAIQQLGQNGFTATHLAKQGVLDIDFDLAPGSAKKTKKRPLPRPASQRRPSLLTTTTRRTHDRQRNASAARTA